MLLSITGSFLGKKRRQREERLFAILSRAACAVGLVAMLSLQAGVSGATESVAATAVAAPAKSTTSSEQTNGQPQPGKDAALLRLRFTVAHDVNPRSGKVSFDSALLVVEQLGEGPAEVLDTAKHSLTKQVLESGLDLRVPRGRYRLIIMKQASEPTRWSAWFTTSVQVAANEERALALLIADPANRLLEPSKGPKHLNVLPGSVLLGAAVATLTSSAALWVARQEVVNDLENICGPKGDSCPKSASSLSTAGRRYSLAAQLTTGLGLAMAAAGVGLVVRPPVSGQGPKDPMIQAQVNAMGAWIASGFSF